MKKILILFLLLLAVNVNAQVKKSKVDFIFPALVKEQGKEKSLIYPKNGGVFAATFDVKNKKMMHVTLYEKVGGNTKELWRYEMPVNKEEMEMGFTHTANGRTAEIIIAPGSEDDYFMGFAFSNANDDSKGPIIGYLFDFDNELMKTVKEDLIMDKSYMKTTVFNDKLDKLFKLLGIEIE